MMDTLLEMAGVFPMVVVIGMVGRERDMDGKGGLAGTTGTAALVSSTLGTGGAASLSLPPFSHIRGFLQSHHQQRFLAPLEKL